MMSLFIKLAFITICKFIIPASAISSNCIYNAKSIAVQTVNAHALDNLARQQFMSILNNRYRNDRTIFPKDQNPLTTDISSDDIADITLFTEILVKDDETLSGTETFLIVQLMEYIDKALQYSRAIIRITFKLRIRLQQIQVCVKSFKTNTHAGACDFEFRHSFQSINGITNRLGFFVNLNKLDKTLQAFVSFQNEIAVSVHSLIDIPEKGEVFIQTEMSHSFNPITMFNFTETIKGKNNKHGRIFPVRALPSTKYFNKCDVTKEYTMLCQLPTPCQNKTLSCHSTNIASMNRTTASTTSIIDLQDFNLSNIKTITFDLVGKGGLVSASTLNQRIPIISIQEVSSKNTYEQNPLNFVHSNMYQIKFNGAIKGTFESSGNKCLAIKLIFVFSNNETETCHFKPYPRGYLLASNHLIFLGHIHSNHSQ